MLPLDTHTCHSVKNATLAGRSQQCPRAKKPGHDYCGYHYRNPVLYSETVLNTNGELALIIIPQYEQQSTAPEPVQSVIETTIPIQSTEEPLPIRRRIIPRPSDVSQRISAPDIPALNPIPLDPSQESKPIPKNSVSTEMILSEPCEIPEHKYIRIIRRPQPLPEYQNDTEFYSLEPVSTIPQRYRFELPSHRKQYLFDIRTLVDYFRNCNELLGYKHPYTNEALGSEQVESIMSIYDRIEQDGGNMKGYVKVDPDFVLTPAQQVRNEAVQVFQRINELGNYAEFQWFLDLDLSELKAFYTSLLDMWLHRLQLTSRARFNLIQNQDPFVKHSPRLIQRERNRLELQRRMLDIINIFITSGVRAGRLGTDNFTTGSIIILSALVEVSGPARRALPHLYQA